MWPDIYHATHQQNGSLWDLRSLLAEPPFSGVPEACAIRERLERSGQDARDTNWWKLTRNGSCSVKSFYSFLNDGGLQYPISKFF